MSPGRRSAASTGRRGCGRDGWRARFARALACRQETPSWNGWRPRSTGRLCASRSSKTDFDRVVIGMEPAFDAGRSGCLGEMQVAGDHRPVADFRYEIRGVELPVAVDHKARGVAEYRRGIEDFRQRLGDARRADVPRDVPRPVQAPASRGREVPPECNCWRDRRRRQSGSDPCGRRIRDAVMSCVIPPLRSR